jgi:hydroxyethylthiazole kinase-like uncharacterized protein yjeF
MKEFDTRILKNLYIPLPDSHKGQNGKLLLIGGSHLFHAASMWALTIASRLLDMVFYASVPENNRIVEHAKAEFRNGIVIRRDAIDDYAEEADAILIGPGMLRTEHTTLNKELRTKNIEEINTLEDEGEQTYWLTKYLLEKYPHKKWVIDAGALQMMEPEWLLQLQETPIITPHPKEFETIAAKVQNETFKKTLENESIEEQVSAFSKEYNCVVLLKGQEDIVSSPRESISIAGGNAGMTKGGTGDVLAGLVAALYCKNDAFTSAAVGSYINKKAGESLYERMGLYFNASDLALEIPAVLHQELEKVA